MNINRRDFVRVSTGVGAVTILAGMEACSTNVKEENKSKGPLDQLKSRVESVVPISVEERKTRIEKAQRLMIENKIDAIYLDGGTSMEYFTGMKCCKSERITAAIILAIGEAKYVGPHFEEDRIIEL